MRGAALPLFQPLIVSFSSLAVVSRPLKSQRILNQHDSEQAALDVGRWRQRLKRHKEVWREITHLLSHQAVLLSQIRKVELLLLGSCAHRLISALKPRLPA